jgi:hypothetical protein
MESIPFGNCISKGHAVVLSYIMNLPWRKLERKSCADIRMLP